MGNPSAGYDGLLAHTVKRMSTELMPNLLYLVSKAIEISEYPSEHKKARVVERELRETQRETETKIFQ